MKGDSYDWVNVSVSAVEASPIENDELQILHKNKGSIKYWLFDSDVHRDKYMSLSVCSQDSEKSKAWRGSSVWFLLSVCYEGTQKDIVNASGVKTRLK